MKKEDRNNEIVKKLLLNLKFRDIIIIKLFRQCICDAYRLGLKDEFNFENQKCDKINTYCNGCSKAVKSKKE